MTADTRTQILVGLYLEAIERVHKTEQKLGSVAADVFRDRHKLDRKTPWALIELDQVLIREKSRVARNRSGVETASGRLIVAGYVFSDRSNQSWALRVEAAKQEEAPMDVKGPVKDATSSAKQNIDSAAGQLQDVANQVTKVGGNFEKAVDKSLADQPYTTLLMVGALGFVLGALWKS